MITNILISEASEPLSAATGLQEPQSLNRNWILSLHAGNLCTEAGTLQEMCGVGAGWPLHGAGHVTPQLHPTVKVIDALLGTDNTSPAPWAGAWSAHAVA